MTVVLLRQIKSLSVVLNVDDLMPANHPYVVAENRLEKIFGNKYTVLIGVTSKHGSVFEPSLLGKVFRITEGLSASDQVVKSNLNSLAARKAKSILGNENGMEVRRFLETASPTLEEAADLEKRFGRLPLFNDILVSTDRKTAIISAEFKRNNAGMAAIDKFVRSIVDPERDGSVEINLGGRPIFQALFEKYGARTGVFFLIAILIVGIVHIEAFRSLQSLFLPLITAIAAVIWALGGLALMGYSLDVFNVMTPILILAIAAGHAVQVLKRYYEEFNELRARHPEMSGRNLSHLAVETSMSKVGPVMLAAGFIAALGFSSLIVFEINTIRIFGIFTAFGILSALVLEMTLIPALRAVLPPPGERELRQERASTIWSRMVDRLFAVSYNQPKKVVGIGIALAVVCAIGALQVKVENELRAYVYGDIEQLKDDKKLNDNTAGTTVYQILVDGKIEDGLKSREIMGAMDELQRFIESDPLVGKTFSIVDLMKQMNRAMNEDKEDQYKIPDSSDLIAQYLFMYANSGEPGDFDSYVDHGYRYASIRVFLKTGGVAYADQLQKRVDTKAKELFGDKADLSAGGGILGSAAINEAMVRDKILNVVQILGCVFIITSLLFRSIIAGALILVPLLAAVLANFGVMGIFGIPLQTTTAFISALAVGIGADYAVYLSYRMREEVQEQADLVVALKRGYVSAGKAVLFVSSAMAGGFGALMFSIGYAAHLWSGMLVALAMVTSALASLTLFPALIFLLKPRYIYGARKKAS